MLFCFGIPAATTKKSRLTPEVDASVGQLVPHADERERLPRLALKPP